MRDSDHCLRGLQRQLRGDSALFSPSSWKVLRSMREAIRWLSAARRSRSSGEQTRHGAITTRGCEPISSFRSLALSRCIADNYEKVVYTTRGVSLHTKSSRMQTL